MYVVKEDLNLSHGGNVTYLTLDISYRVDMLSVRLQHLLVGTDEAAIDAVEGPRVFAYPPHMLVPDVRSCWNSVHFGPGDLGHI